MLVVKGMADGARQHFLRVPRISPGRVNPLATSITTDYCHSSLRGMARHPQSVSTISLQSAPSSVSGSPRRNGSSIADLPPSPRPTSLTSRTPAVATAPQSESLISQIVSPRIQSPIVSTRSFSSLSEHLARNAAPPVRPSLSRQPTPRVPTPVLSPIRSRSRTTATPAIHSVPRTYSSRKPSVTAGRLLHLKCMPTQSSHLRLLALQSRRRILPTQKRPSREGTIRRSRRPHQSLSRRRPGQLCGIAESAKKIHVPSLRRPCVGTSSAPRTYSPPCTCTLLRAQLTRAYSY